MGISLRTCRPLFPTRVIGPLHLEELRSNEVPGMDDPNRNGTRASFGTFLSFLATQNFNFYHLNGKIKMSGDTERYYTENKTYIYICFDEEHILRLSMNCRMFVVK